MSQKRTWMQIGLLGLAAAVSLGGYLVYSARYFRVGFPLDDAWIHQTYARNLALRGEWAFIPGHPSAGSTSPLWTLLLAPGHWLPLSPYLWTFLLGWLSLVGVGLLGMRIFQRLAPSRARLAGWAGLFLVLEWHLVWAAGSGMETLLFSLLVLAVLGELVGERQNWLLLGCLVGVSVWLRPDGITLVGPVLLALGASEKSWHKRWSFAAAFGVGAFLCIVPYLWMNLKLSGAWLPNTFFAKQAEYAVHRQIPLWIRYAQQLRQLVIGAGILLIPGFVLSLVEAFRRRAWGSIAGGLWMLGYLFIYALRLPVTYQFGRYIIPAMPVYFIWSLAGVSIFVRPFESVRWRRLLGRVWLSSLALVSLSFWFVGGRAYAQSVAIIESEMVDMARWISENTEPQSLIAAHDIGALGYFGQRPLVDLAGLVSPQVIPFLRDEKRLAAFISDSDAAYLMTFPGWYPELIQPGSLVFCTQGRYSPLQGGENMCLYRWRQ